MHRKTVGLDDAFWCARVGTKAVPTHRSNNVSALGLHPLAGSLARHYAVKVNGNWRLTFMFENGGAVLVDYQDYH
jgi:plasmid maintenance system killer protein